MLHHVMNTCSFIAGRPAQRGWAQHMPGDLMFKGGESVRELEPAVNQNQLIMNNEIRWRERGTARHVSQTIEQR